MVTSYLTGQLISFADGLVEYTEQRLQGLPPEASAVPVPFNLLSEQILDVNIYEVHSQYDSICDLMPLLDLEYVCSL